MFGCDTRVTDWCVFVCSRIMRVESADEFYTAMGSIAQDMLDNSIIGADELIKVSTVKPLINTTN